MKLNYWTLLMNLILLPHSKCYQNHLSHHHQKERSDISETTTALGPSLEDKEILKEALHLLNIGKKTLGLGTENPDLLLQLVENSSEKPHRIQQVLQLPFTNKTQFGGEQYLVLSGKDGHIRLENYTNTTDASITFNPKSNGSDIEDVFKMVMEKKYPEKTGKGKMFHKITIIESNQLKPFDKKQFPRPAPIAFIRSRRHKEETSKKMNSISLSRIKRKDQAIHQFREESYPVVGLFDEDIDEEENRKNGDIIEEGRHIFVERHRFSPRVKYHPVHHRKSKKKLQITDSTEPEQLDQNEAKDESENSFSDKPFLRDDEKSLKNHELLKESVLIAHLLQQLPTNEKSKVEKSDNVRATIIWLLVITICMIIILLIYWKWCKISNSRSYELKNANVFAKLGESWKKNYDFSDPMRRKLFDNFYNKRIYHLVPIEEPVAELEWQSEVGDWLSDRDLEEKRICS